MGRVKRAALEALMVLWCSRDDDSDADGDDADHTMGQRGWGW